MAFGWPPNAVHIPWCERYLVDNEQVVFIESSRVTSIAYNETGSVEVHALLITTVKKKKTKNTVIKKEQKESSNIRLTELLQKYGIN